MFLRILLGVACLSLLTASEAEAQFFRRRFAPRPAQPQQYVPRNGYSQNGYQGRLTATPRSRPMFVRRPDGSIARYYPPTNPVGNAQSAANRTRQAQLANQANQERLANRAKQTQIANGANQAQGANRQPQLATTQGQLRALRPSTQLVQRRANAVYQPPIAVPARPQSRVAPVGVSVMNPPEAQTAIGSISPAATMPEASTASAIDSVAAIPVNTAATNPVPTGLTLSAPNDVAPASATVPVETSSVDEPGKLETFSVLESIE